MIRQTHTYANLEVSPAAYDEVAAKLRAARYDHVFSEHGEIDMNGIALVASAEPLNDALAEMTRQKDAAYEERNKLVAVLTKFFPSGTARTAIEGWSDDWHGCVYIDLPSGQVSWHYHDSQAHLFADLPPYPKPWDGHTTEEKYRRLAALELASCP